jgi:hypothetical protein
VARLREEQLVGMRDRNRAPADAQEFHAANLTC